MGRKGKKRTHEGELTWLNVRRGYGFIKSDAWHEEIFVLVEDITLADGTKLEWTQQGSNNSAHNFQKLAIGSTLKFQLRVSQETQAHATKARVTNNGSGKSDDSSKKSNNKKKSKSRVTSIEDEQRRDSLGEDLSDSEKKRKTKKKKDENEIEVVRLNEDLDEECIGEDLSDSPPSKKKSKKKKDENEIEVVRLNEDLDEEVIAAAAELDAQVAKQNVSSAFPKKTKTSRSRHARQITADTNDFRDDNGVYDLIDHLPDPPSNAPKRKKTKTDSPPKPKPQRSPNSTCNRKRGGGAALIDHLPEPPSNAPKRKKTKTDSLPKPKPQRSPNSTRNRKRGGGGAASVGSRIFGSFGGFMRSNPTAMATGAHNFGSSSRLSVAAANRNNSSTAGGRHRSQKSSQESLRQRFVDTDEVDMYEKPLQMLQRNNFSAAAGRHRAQKSSQESLRQRFVDTDEVDMYEKPLQMLQTKQHLDNDGGGVVIALRSRRRKACDRDLRTRTRFICAKSPCKCSRRNNSSPAKGRHRSQKSSQESLRQRFVDTNEVDMYEKPLQTLQRVLNSRANSQTRQQISVVLSAIYTLTLEAHSSLQKRVSDGRIAARRNPPDRPAECQVCFADFPSSSSLDKLPEPMLQLKRTPSDHEDANATSEERSSSRRNVNLPVDDSDTDVDDSSPSSESESGSDSDATMSCMNHTRIRDRYNANATSDARSSSRRNVNLPGDDSGTDVDDSSSSSESGSGSDSDATMSSAHSSSRSSDTMSDDESKTPAITPAAESAEPDACRAVMANCKCGDVCETCVKQYIATLTRDKDVSPWVVCPSASCKMPLSHTDLIGLIPVATLYELAGEVLRNFVARSPRWLECKKDGCNFGFLAPPVDDVEGGRTKMCQVCGTRQKVKAKQTAPDDSLKELIDQGLMRLCPQCKHPAMKDYGMCNVMKCGRCSTWWNWRNYQVGASYSDVKQKARWSGTLWEPGELSYQLNLQRSKPEEFQRLLERNGIAYDPNFVRGQN